MCELTTMMRYITAASLLLWSCEKPEPPVVVADAGPPPPPSTATEVAAKPPELSGVLQSKSHVELEWKQEIDAGRILDLAVCGNRVYTLAQGGRIVEWTVDPAAPKTVLSTFGAVTSIDANDQMLLAGTEDGRILHSSCDAASPTAVEGEPFPVRWVQTDPRSKARVFVAYEVAAPDSGMAGPALAVTLVDLESGDLLREPYKRPWTPGSHIVGFNDYRGELWFVLNPSQGRSGVWYLERFDQNMPPLAGLGDDVLRGFIQLSREVWGFGGTVDGAKGLVYRVDTNRAKPMFDGVKGWFGEPPGGDPPKHPIVGITKVKKDLFVATTHDVLVADPELRRFKRLYSNDPVDGVLSTATTAVETKNRVLYGTHHGLVTVTHEGWTRATVAAPTLLDAGQPVSTRVSWRAESWEAGPRGLSVTKDGGKPRPFPHGPRKTVRGLFVDGDDRLWAFADDATWLVTGSGRDEAHSFDTVPVGLAGSTIATAASGNAGSIVVGTTYGAQVRLRVEPPPPPDTDR